MYKDDSLVNILERYDENSKVEPFITEEKDYWMKKYPECIQEIKNYIERYKDDDNMRLWGEEELKKFEEAKTDEDKAEVYAEYNNYSGYDEDLNMTSDWNPDAKWDWWEVGGRWEGFLRAVSRKYDNPVEVETNQAPIIDVDWRKMWDKEELPYFYIDIDGEWHEEDPEGFKNYVIELKKQDPDIIAVVVDCHD